VELLEYWRSQQGSQQGVMSESLKRLQGLARSGAAAGLPTRESWQQGAVPRAQPPVWSTFSDTDEDHLDEGDRVPFWNQDESYSERGRQWRRTVFMHDDWVRHRSSNRFVRNMKTLGSSGINQALSKELTFVTLDAFFVVVINMFFVGYQDLSGVMHPGVGMPAVMLPALPFTILMPALSLLLVFRTNTGYARWNEARTLWGGLINNCRNVVRQSNTFFPEDKEHEGLKRRMAAETTVFIKSLRNFLRGPEDDETLRKELYDLVDTGLISKEQADATMAASNRPMFSLSAMSATLRKASIDPQHSARIDATIGVLVDLTGANERIFKSPIPLVYTRLTARFLTIFLTLLPLALWGQLGESWNHWATIPAEFIISFFLFGIEEVGIQIEEPFSILPLEAFCNSAIAACNEEILGAVDSGVFEHDEYEQLQ
jgi:putative membrane protein